MRATLRRITLVVWIGVAPVALSEDLASVIHASFSDSGQATLLRLEQDPLQQRCSQPRDERVDDDISMALRQERLNAVVFPEDGNFLGDWQRGAAVAASGRGLQSNDDPSIANGGNCYACHQLAPTEVAYGTLGPPLTQYGLRGQSDAMLRYTWTKLWDTHAFNLCSHMPRFGAQKILTEQQLKDVMAFLLDPNSSVNQPAEGPSSAH